MSKDLCIVLQRTNKLGIFLSIKLFFYVCLLVSLLRGEVLFRFGVGFFFWKVFKQEHKIIKVLGKIQE